MFSRAASAAFTLLSSMLSTEMPRSTRRTTGRSFFKTPQSAESKKFHLDRAVDKRKRKGAILRDLAERGHIGFSDQELIKFDRDNFSEFHRTDIYADTITTNTIDSEPVKPITADDLKSLKQNIDEINAEQKAIADNLPPGCRLGPLIGEITITDPALWERILQHPDIKPKNKRKHTIFEHDITAMTW